MPTEAPPPPTCSDEPPQYLQMTVGEPPPHVVQAEQSARLVFLGRPLDDGIHDGHEGRGRKEDEDVDRRRLGPDHSAAGCIIGQADREGADGYHSSSHSGQSDDEDAEEEGNVTPVLPQTVHQRPLERAASCRRTHDLAAIAADIGGEEGKEESDEDDAGDYDDGDNNDGGNSRSADKRDATTHGDRRHSRTHCHPRTRRRNAPTAAIPADANDATKLVATTDAGTPKRHAAPAAAGAAQQRGTGPPRPPPPHPERLRSAADHTTRPYKSWVQTRTSTFETVAS